MADNHVLQEFVGHMGVEIGLLEGPDRLEDFSGKFNMYI
jgi:hypothetical protein